MLDVCSSLIHSHILHKRLQPSFILYRICSSLWFLSYVFINIIGRRLIPFEIWSILIFMLISLGGSSLLSAYDRQFRVLVPIVLLWIFYTGFNIIKIDIRR